tara:strand:+ start:972 stop:2045 length:1074 start_codon:yes stop_codon:yes gene_type:complete
MTDENQIEDQDIELHDEVTDDGIMEKASHDPKNAPAQAVAATDKAGDAAGDAKDRPTDNTTQDPMPKTKAGMINAMTTKLMTSKKMDVQSMYQSMMNPESYHEDVESDDQPQLVEYQADFEEDLNALVESEATLSDEFKGKAGIIFETAIRSKLSEEIDRLETKYNEELAEEVESTKSDLVEKVDNYLNYVVEQWMDDNKVAVQTGLRTEIAEKFMGNLKDLFVESYIEVPESKVDLVDQLAEEVAELEAASNEAIAKNLSMMEELETYKRDAIIREHASGLAETQIEKLKDLVAEVEFDDEDTFAQKVETVKESYFTKKSSESADITEESDDGDAVVESTGSMAQYLQAIQRTNKK